MATCAVSESRTSPTMMTSGSWRTNERSAAAKVKPIAGLICAWLTPGMSYSTGSSTVRILRPGSFRIDKIVASVVVLPLPVGPVMTIMPCGSFSNRLSATSSAGENPSFSTTSRPRSFGRIRITADSPCCIGMIATRMSISVRPARSRAAPSCGSRRSAILRLATILMREITACGSTPAGAATGRSKPSMRMRTTSPV